MGCRVSRASEDGTADSLVNTGPLSSRKRTRPINLDKVSWSSDLPMTRTQLHQQRESFWETAPAYDGHPESWATLHAVVSACATEPTLAQTILDSSGLTLPTGRLTDGCYDDRGRRYIIPPYCLWEPENLLEDDRPSHLSIDEDITPYAEDHSEVRVLIRLSTNKDLRFLCLASDRLRALTRRIAEKEELPEHAISVRYLKLGRILDQDSRLAMYIKEGEPNILLQAMVTPIPTDE